MLADKNSDLLPLNIERWIALIVVIRAIFIFTGFARSSLVAQEAGDIEDLGY